MVSAVMPCPAKAASPCMMSGRTLALPSRPMRVLLGAGASHGHGVDGFQMAGVRHQVNADLAAVCGVKYAGCADVILHVAAAENAAGIDVFEAGEDFCGSAADDVDNHVQASAMAHAPARACSAPFSAAAFEDFVEQRNERGVAFERITFGSDVARLHGLLEDVGADELVENALRVDGRRGSDSMRSWIQRRRSGSGMCMNSTPMVPQ